MGIFLVYALKASVCLAVFYLFYRLLLSKETFHRFNRLALLGVLLLSCLIPLVEVTVYDAPEISQPFLTLEEMMLMAEPFSVVEKASAPFPWRALMLVVYLIGILFFLGRHLWSLGCMLSLLHASRKERLEGGITLYVHESKEVAPFSWMGNIAISKYDLEENGDAVLTHERAHVYNHHSWDLLLAEGCVFLQWFNPAVWLLKQELQIIHEYEADEWVIENGIDAKRYQLLLIKKAVGARLYSIANSFNHSSLKKRITMMIKKKSNPWARLKYVYVLPLAAVVVAAFARPEVSNELVEISNAKVNDLTSIMKEIGQEKEDTLSKTTLHETVINTSIAHEKLSIRLDVGKKPLFVIDDRPFPSLTIDDINAAMVDSMVVLKSDVAIKTYGEKAKDGAILLFSKRPEETKVIRGVKFNVPVSEEKEQSVKQEEIKMQPQEEVIFQVVEEMPQFPGGMAEAMKFLAKNMKYPQVAQQAKIEGSVIVQFVVERDGSVSDVGILRGVSPDLDAEAVRVVSMMPKWIPGKQRGKAVAVKYAMPIMFRLQSPEPKKEETASFQQINLKVNEDADMDNVVLVKSHLKTRGMKVHDVEGKSPLIIVDNEVKGNGADVLSKVPVDQIKSVTVLKDKVAIAIYGDKAKDGVIVVETKNITNNK